MHGSTIKVSGTLQASAEMCTKYYTFELYYTSVCCFRLETAAICRLNCFYCTCSNVVNLVASVHMYDDSLK